MHPVVEAVTERIRKRSAASRRDYLERINAAAIATPPRTTLGCSNIAHGIAACGADGKARLLDGSAPNLAIVTAYNDMLSAHQPYENYPERIRRTAWEAGAIAQVAGGVPAMCDGVTQGRPGMELSLFSRDLIAMATAVSLSHDIFDAALCLGICDKIVPGLVIGALSFGHLPTIFVPSGPMRSGLPNKEKASVRERHAAGEVDRDALIAAESASYHSPGTCTFYGTANSNQMLMEFMGLQLPASAFEPPDTPLRHALTNAAVHRAITIALRGKNPAPIGHIINEASIVNGMIGLLATGGSTNHTLHLPAIAAAAGLRIDWQDFAELAEVVPLLAEIYPNGSADVNHFHAAGGLGFVIAQLLDAGLLHEEVLTVAGLGLRHYTTCAHLEHDDLSWHPAPVVSANRDVLRELHSPFQAEGGLRLLEGNLGRAIVKVSAVAPEHRRITAPARIFPGQAEFLRACEAGELNGDLIAVVRFQGPAANGMPELHKLSPYLGVLQNKGQKVALLTDGRMSGASGKVLAAIHVTPEAKHGGAIARLRDGDLVCIDADTGLLEAHCDLDSREAVNLAPGSNSQGVGRELFRLFRDQVSAADAGACVFRHEA